MNRRHPTRRAVGRVGHSVRTVVQRRPRPPHRRPTHDSDPRTTRRADLPDRPCPTVPDRLRSDASA